MPHGPSCTFASSKDVIFYLFSLVSISSFHLFLHPSCLGLEHHNGVNLFVWWELVLHEVMLAGPISSGSNPFHLEKDSFSICLIDGVQVSNIIKEPKLCIMFEFCAWKIPGVCWIKPWTVEANFHEANTLPLS